MRWLAIRNRLELSLARPPAGPAIPHPELRATFSRREKDSCGAMAGCGSAELRTCTAFPLLRERAPKAGEGCVRRLAAAAGSGLAGHPAVPTIPHPALRATFSRREKDSCGAMARCGCHAEIEHTSLFPLLWERVPKAGEGCFGPQADRRSALHVQRNALCLLRPSSAVHKKAPQWRGSSILTWMAQPRRRNSGRGSSAAAWYVTEKSLRPSRAS